MYVFSLALAVAATSGMTAAHADNTGLFPNRMCWRPAGNTVELHFNAALAPELENPARLDPPDPSLGNAADRVATVRHAVDAWNAALAAVGAPFHITLALGRSPSPFAGQQGNPPSCMDPVHGTPVFPADYRRHRGDNTSTGSTGENALNGPRFGPGWVQGGNTMSLAIDQRLAETTHVPPSSDPLARQIRESDILWFTHFSEGNRCPQIRWAYRFLGPAAAPMPYYDFYSVMLHEIGHYLGLDHQSCPQVKAGAPVRNVMEDTIAPGTRSAILPCETAALARLYGRGAPCGPGAPRANPN